MHVLTGGGERDFDLRPGQSLRVNGMARIEDGREIPMKRGTLDEVELETWPNLLIEPDGQVWRGRNIVQIRVTGKKQAGK